MIYLEPRFERPGLSLILLCIAVFGQRRSQLGHSCP